MADVERRGAAEALESQTDERRLFTELPEGEGDGDDGTATVVLGAAAGTIAGSFLGPIGAVVGAMAGGALAGAVAGLEEPLDLGAEKETVGHEARAEVFAEAGEATGPGLDEGPGQDR